MENKNKQRIKYIIVILIIIVLLLAFSFLLNMKLVLDYERNYDESNLIHGMIIDDTKAYGDYFLEKELPKGTKVLIIKNEDGKYLIKYEHRLLRVDEQYVDYYTLDKDKEVSTMVDVSSFNIKGNVFNDGTDLALFLLRNDIDYLYIRIGGRGYGAAGNFYKDDNYETYIEAAEYLKIPYGFYYLDEAKDENEINEEVKFVVDFLKEHDLKYNQLPLTIDIEYHGGSGRIDDEDIWINERTNLLNTLVDKFKKNSINTIIYANASRASKYLSDVNANFWIAYYDESGKIPTKWINLSESVSKENEEFLRKVIGWQFSEKGAKYDDIPEVIDLSIVVNKYFLKYIK